jgi:hypothetical protein
MIKTRKNKQETTNDSKLVLILEEYLKNVQREEILDNLHLFIPRLILNRILAINFLYQKIVSHSGIILEFGCRYGGNLALYNNFRGTYEPFNYTRKIVGFDTFDGFPSVSEIDDTKVGDYSVIDNYEKMLIDLLNIHNDNSPISHIEKNEIHKGDILNTLPAFLEKNTRVLSLVYFDMDLYVPTLKALELIKPFLSKGSIIVFDDFNNERFLGESKAVLEFFGNYNNIQFNSIPFYPRLTFIQF